MITRTTLALGAIALLGGCAADTAGITTSAVDPKLAPVATASKVDPACVSLMSQIDGLRKEGVSERVEKAASKGKTATVAVKRTSLAKMAELDKANAEFQAKCSTISPSAGQSAAAPSPVTGAVTNAVTNAASPAATKATSAATKAATKKAAAVVAPVLAKTP